MARRTGSPYARARRRKAKAAELMVKDLPRSAPTPSQKKTMTATKTVAGERWEWSGAPGEVSGGLARMRGRGRGGGYRTIPHSKSRQRARAGAILSPRFGGWV